jgi:hypothetical protein
LFKDIILPLYLIDFFLRGRVALFGAGTSDEEATSATGASAGSLTTAVCATAEDSAGAALLAISNLFHFLPILFSFL